MVTEKKHKAVLMGTPEYFYDELLTAVGFGKNYKRVYDALSQIFRQCLNQNTEHVRITFSGDFAKADYLLKEHRAPARLVKAVNDTRVRLRRRQELSEADMKCYYRYDLKSLCQLVALIYQADIPQSLLTLLPTDTVPNYTPRLTGEYMRVIVERWDDNYVYALSETTASGEPLRVSYAYGNQAYRYDWTYLKELFYEGAQLNLIRPREENGIIYAELIILEPDYLVNITTIAHCFTNYAESPLVDLIRRLEPQQATEATLLGSLAGQLLDEAIHQAPGSHSYADSARTFFRDHALSLLTTATSPQFHQEALRQQHNITQALYTTLPQALTGFDAREGIVEPSFYSEMLGLQGRMDYLQSDYKVLMEQKSGKGKFPYDNFTIPRSTEEHLVQMMLYLAVIKYNYADTYRRNKGIHAFLLYSKYASSLLTIGSASPELTFRAVKMRNALVRAERDFTQPGGYQMLCSLTPEKLNQEHATNKLWTVWQRPMIASILDPIQKATELERRYYLRFLTFIANEHAMQKLGNKSKEGSGFAATWLDSLQEKRQAGNIYDGLTLIEPDEHTQGRITEVKLLFEETKDNDMQNFRTGDIVMLYPYKQGKEPDARRTMVHRCTISSIQPGSISLKLRAAQADGRVLLASRHQPWAIEHDFMESTYSALYRGMQALLTAPQSRRDLILLQREPETDRNLTLKGHYKEFDDLALRVKRARDLFLIIGPPGTGKTSYGMLYTVKEQLMEDEGNVLIMAYTNRAVDEICSKLEDEGIRYVRIGGDYTCADRYRSHLLTTIANKSSHIEALRNTIRTTRAIVGTTTALSSHIPLLQQKTFGLAVIDEASQILEPHLMALLCAHTNGVPTIRKIVMIGDHKQLPAVVQQGEDVSRVDDRLLNGILLTDCRLSLFERLLKRYHRNDDVTYMLHRQGRMHPEIAIFPNKNFYGGKLEAVPLPHQTKPLPATPESHSGIASLISRRRIAFIDAQKPDNSPSDKVNQVEANMIAAMVVAIYEAEACKGFEADHTVGVIVPYRNQIATVRHAIGRLVTERYGTTLSDIATLQNITIDTVERYQGSQRKYIIYGFTIQRLYQLRFLTSNVFEDSIDHTLVDRKLNVAMTRAEEHLLMVGNESLLTTNQTFGKLIDFLRDKQSFFSIPEADFVTGHFCVPPLAN